MQLSPFTISCTAVSHPFPLPSPPPSCNAISHVAVSLCHFPPSYEPPIAVTQCHLVPSFPVMLLSASIFLCHLPPPTASMATIPCNDLMHCLTPHASMRVHCSTCLHPQLLLNALIGDSIFIFDCIYIESNYKLYGILNRKSHSVQYRIFNFVHTWSCKYPDNR